MCKLLKVNRSYFYHFLVKQKNEKAVDCPLEKELKEIFNHHRGNYGSRRLTKELNKKGFVIGRYKVRSLMKKLGLEARYPKRFKATTDSNHDYPIADNLLNREFDVEAPNQVWTTDITYVWTLQGWMYLAIVVDLYSRQIIGWSVQDHMRTSLCLDALEMAWWRRGRPDGVLHHSDRGSQYASKDYQKQLQAYGMTCSMSRKGNCWDNSPTERVFRTLKSEWLNRFKFSKKELAKRAIWDYVTYYNSERSHSLLGYMSPMEFEREAA